MRGFFTYSENSNSLRGSFSLVSLYPTKSNNNWAKKSCEKLRHQIPGTPNCHTGSVVMSDHKQRESLGAAKVKYTLIVFFFKNSCLKSKYNLPVVTHPLKKFPFPSSCALDQTCTVFDPLVLFCPNSSIVIVRRWISYWLLKHVCLMIICTYLTTKQHEKRGSMSSDES